MLINKDLNKIMRSGGIKEPRKQNNSSIIVAVCGFIMGLIVCFAVMARAEDGSFMFDPKWQSLEGNVYHTDDKKPNGNIIIIKPIKDSDAIKAIIGEAENQEYTGMLAVACAIRNRMTLNGVFGLNAYRVKHKMYSAKTLSLATKAWLESDEHDITNGATHWENINAFGSPYWEKDMVKTFAFKDHIFYKQKEK